MEGYIKKMIFLGENIQTIRKHRKMKQQELADKIGINMQSLSKIEGRTELRAGWKIAALPYGSRAERLFRFNRF